MATKDKISKPRMTNGLVYQTYTSFSETHFIGEFEYPKGSNQWYQGKHIPIITKELFDKAQEALNANFSQGRMSRENLPSLKSSNVATADPA